MDDLRWVLLLVGAVVLVAVYFFGGFDREGWAQERKQSRARRQDKTDRKDIFAGQSVVTARGNVKKEPGMGMMEPESAFSGPVSPTSETKSGQEEILADDKMEAVNAEYFDIEDDISGTDIPVGLVVEKAEVHIPETIIVSEEVPEQAAILPPGVEPLVLSVSILSEEEDFSGPAIKEALEAEGLRYGALHIFHFYDPDKKDVFESDDAVFSVASVLEPGTFTPEEPDKMQAPGLMLFCQLPGPVSGDVALELMLEKGRGLAARLHGHMCDDKRSRFTAQARNHYQDRIAAFNRKLVLARKKTSVN